MNVLSDGYDNPISMSVTGMPNSQVQASITNGNGSLKQGSGGFVAHPTQVGQEAVIRVTADMDGRSQVMGDYAYQEVGIASCRGRGCPSVEVTWRAVAVR